VRGKQGRAGPREGSSEAGLLDDGPSEGGENSGKVIINGKLGALLLLNKKRKKLPRVPHRQTTGNLLESNKKKKGTMRVPGKGGGRTTGVA